VSRGARALICALSLAQALGAEAQDEEPGRRPEPPPEEFPPPPRGEPLPPPVWPRRPPDPEDALGRDEAREGSGTAWQPLASPRWGAHLALGPAALMLHGSAFLAYTDQGSPRGDRAVFAPTWGMAMARLPLGPGAVAGRVMISLDPVTMPANGYPELLQTGESAGGQPLHDRQHPHDLFMELAAIARAPLGDGAALVLYGAPVGEPALGPVAYPHRASALHDPVAPLAHHWLDSTHISYGVLTAGLALRDAKLEGSWFNGREPDEHRTDLDPIHLDSWAARLSVAPRSDLALQASFGRLASPERLAPGESVHRLTVSAMWADRVGDRGVFALTGAWGRNVEAGRAEDALLAEGTWDRDGHDAIFGRLEWVEKSAAELVVPGLEPTSIYGVVALSAGYAHTFGPWQGVALALGMRGTVNGVPTALRDAYASTSPVGFVLFAQVLPAQLPPGAGHGAAHHEEHAPATEHGHHHE
jgi:hypothetical protein